MALLKLNSNSTPVDCSGRRVDSSENANAFPSCVGRFEEAYQCPAGLAGQVRPRRSKATRRLSASPKEELLMKKTAVGLFHIFQRKAKRLERKSTVLFNRAYFMYY